MRQEQDDAYQASLAADKAKVYKYDFSLFIIFNRLNIDFLFKIPLSSLLEQGNRSRFFFHDQEICFKWTSMLGNFLIYICVIILNLAVVATGIPILLKYAHAEVFR